MTTGEKIRAARKKAGLTQTELAERLGVGYSAVGQWELGLRNPKFETLKKISAALGCSISTLFSCDNCPFRAQSGRKVKVYPRLGGVKNQRI